MLRMISLAFVAIGLTACGADPRENLTAVPEIFVAQEPKAVASCLHSALERTRGAGFKTEDLTFKNEIRFTESVELSCLAGIGQCGTWTTWSISVVPRSNGSAVFVNAQGVFARALQANAGHCLAPASIPQG